MAVHRCSETVYKCCVYMCCAHVCVCGDKMHARVEVQSYGDMINVHCTVCTAAQLDV